MLMPAPVVDDVPLLEITFTEPGATPPIVLKPAPATRMPFAALPTAVDPSEPRPDKLPVTCEPDDPAARFRPLAVFPESTLRATTVPVTAKPVPDNTRPSLALPLGVMPSGATPK